MNVKTTRLASLLVDTCYEEFSVKFGRLAITETAKYFDNWSCAKKFKQLFILNI